MKAEQRKELETNTLADKMGHVVQRVKAGQRRTLLVYIVVGIAAVVILALSYRWYSISRGEAGMQWVELDDGTAASLNKLGKLNERNEPEITSAAGKAARLQIAWLIFWEGGVEMIGADPAGSMDRLRDAGTKFRNVANESKDDALFEPQALLGVAVVEETKAVQDRKFLDNSIGAYEEVVNKYPESAAGKFAKGRIDQLKDKEKRQKVALVYEELQKLLRVPPLQQMQLGNPGGMMPGLPPGHPPVPDDEKKK